MKFSISYLFIIIFSISTIEAQFRVENALLGYKRNFNKHALATEVNFRNGDNELGLQILYKLNSIQRDMQNYANYLRGYAFTPTQHIGFAVNYKRFFHLPFVTSDCIETFTYAEVEYTSMGVKSINHFFVGLDSNGNEIKRKTVVEDKKANPALFAALGLGFNVDLNKRLFLECRGGLTFGSIFLTLPDGRRYSSTEILNENVILGLGYRINRTQ